MAQTHLDLSGNKQTTPYENLSQFCRCVTLPVNQHRDLLAPLWADLTIYLKKLMASSSNTENKATSFSISYERGKVRAHITKIMNQVNSNQNKTREEEDFTAQLKDYIDFFMNVKDNELLASIQQNDIKDYAELAVELEQAKCSDLELSFPSTPQTQTPITTIRVISPASSQHSQYSSPATSSARISTRHLTVPDQKKQKPTASTATGKVSPLVTPEQKRSTEINVKLQLKSGILQTDTLYTFYDKSEEFGSPNAQRELAYAFLQGTGVTQDEAKACYYLELSASQGDAKSQCDLAKLYLKGQGVKKDEKTAFELLKSSADKENSDARYYLGKMYRKGVGEGESIVVERNESTAAFYFRLANTPKSLEALENLASQMQKEERFYVDCQYYAATATENSYALKILLLEHQYQTYIFLRHDLKDPSQQERLKGLINNMSGLLLISDIKILLCHDYSVNKDMEDDSHYLHHFFIKKYCEQNHLTFLGLLERLLNGEEGLLNSIFQNAVTVNCFFTNIVHLENQFNTAADTKKIFHQKEPSAASLSPVQSGVPLSPSNIIAQLARTSPAVKLAPIEDGIATYFLVKAKEWEHTAAIALFQRLDGNNNATKVISSHEKNRALTNLLRAAVSDSKINAKSDMSVIAREGLIPSPTSNSPLSASPRPHQQTSGRTPKPGCRRLDRKGT